MINYPSLRANSYRKKDRDVCDIAFGPFIVGQIYPVFARKVDIEDTFVLKSAQSSEKPMSNKGTTHFEVIFSRNDGDVSKYIDVCIELNDEDKQVLQVGENARMNTHAILERTGILQHLQNGIHNWHYSGRVMRLKDERASTARLLNGRKIWVIAGG